jgi:hypothetical protein
MPLIPQHDCYRQTLRLDFESDESPAAPATSCEAGDDAADHRPATSSEAHGGADLPPAVISEECGAGHVPASIGVTPAGLTILLGADPSSPARYRASVVAAGIAAARLAAALGPAAEGGR